MATSRTGMVLATTAATVTGTADAVFCDSAREPRFACWTISTPAPSTASTKMPEKSFFLVDIDGDARQTFPRQFSYLGSPHRQQVQPTVSTPIYAEGSRRDI
jgi:hypothetical protein